jgi:hypothetical protein
VIKNGTKEAEAELGVQEAANNSQAENCGKGEQEVLEQNGLEVTQGTKEMLINDGGV